MQSCNHLRMFLLNSFNLLTFENWITANVIWMNCVSRSFFSCDAETRSLDSFSEHCACAPTNCVFKWNYRKQMIQHADEVQARCIIRMLKCATCDILIGIPCHEWIIVQSVLNIIFCVWLLLFRLSIVSQRIFGQIFHLNKCSNYEQSPFIPAIL